MSIPFIMIITMNLGGNPVISMQEFSTFGRCEEAKTVIHKSSPDVEIICQPK